MDLWGGPGSATGFGKQAYLSLTLEHAINMKLMFPERIVAALVGQIYLLPSVFHHPEAPGCAAVQMDVMSEVNT